MTTRTCTVKSHVRKLPVKPSPFETDVNQQLMKAFAIDVMERQIERIVRTDLALRPQVKGA